MTTDRDRTENPDDESFSEIWKWAEQIEFESEKSFQDADGQLRDACRIPKAEQTESREEALRELFGRAVECRKLSDGLVFVFEPDSQLLSDLVAFIDMERRCCPFFEFGIHVNSSEGRILFKIGGSPEIRDALAEQTPLADVI